MTREPIMSSALEQAQLIARNEPLDAASPELSQSLLHAAQEKLERDHAASAQLKKSTELNAYIRLLDEERIFPSGSLLAERLDLCLEILQRCPQRPVLEQVGLTLLELDFTHAWTTSHAEVLEAILALDTKQSRHRTIPMLALCMHHSRAFATHFATRIADSSLTDKKIRVGELIETLYILPREEPLDAFVDLAYEAIFAKTSPADKIELLRRVIQECLAHDRVLEENKWNFIGEEMTLTASRPLEHERWTLLIDPIISQNLQHVEVVEMLSQLIEMLPQEHATRYLTNYTISMAQRRRMLTDNALNLLETHASANLIPYLYPSTQLTERTLLGTRKTPYAMRVAQIIEAIIAREQLDRNAGGLSLSEQSAGGGLTVLDASHGTLSIEAVSSTSSQAFDPATLLPPIHEPMTRDLEQAPRAGLDTTRLALFLVFIVLMVVLSISYLF